MKKRLLLVDDEPTIRLTLGTILERRGYAVTTAATVAEALAAMQTDNYDVLVSDLNVGAPYDGFTIASAIRRIHPKIATVMITGYPAFEAALQSIRQQVDDYLIKPTDVDELVSRIEEKLAQRKEYVPPQQRRAIAVIGENRHSIMERWLASVESDRELTKLTLSRAQRTGHLPHFLDALTAQVEAHQLIVGVAAREAASLHGEERQRMGYSIPLMLRETRMLATVIYEVLQEFLLDVKVSRLIPDMVEILNSINEQMEISVQAYLALQQPHLG